MQRKQYDEYIKRLLRNRPNASDSDLPKLQLRLPVNESMKKVQDFEKKGIGNQSVLETLTYLVAKFSVFLDTEGSHLMEKSYKLEISKVQNQSSIMFFLLV